MLSEDFSTGFVVSAGLETKVGGFLLLRGSCARRSAACLSFSGHKARVSANKLPGLLCELLDLHCSAVEFTLFVFGRLELALSHTLLEVLIGRELAEDCALQHIRLTANLARPTPLRQ